MQKARLMNGVSSLVWDVDGTLVDTYPAIVTSVVEALRTLGKAREVREGRVAELCSVSMGHCVQTLAEDLAIEAETLRSLHREIYREMPLDMQRPFPGAVTVCSYIRSRGGKNLILTHRSRASLERMLAFHDLTPWFSDIIAGDDGFPRKPDPSSLHVLLDRNRVESEGVMLVGDRELDIRAAHAAGVPACLFGDTAIDEPADWQVDDHYEFLARLRKQEMPPI